MSESHMRPPKRGSHETKTYAHAETGIRYAAVQADSWLVHTALCADAPTGARPSVHARLTPSKHRTPTVFPDAHEYLTWVRKHSGSLRHRSVPTTQTDSIERVLSGKLGGVRRPRNPEAARIRHPQARTETLPTRLAFREGSGLLASPTVAIAGAAVRVNAMPKHTPEVLPKGTAVRITTQGASLQARQALLKARTQAATKRASGGKSGAAKFNMETWQDDTFHGHVLSWDGSVGTYTVQLTKGLHVKVPGLPPACVSLSCLSRAEAEGQRSLGFTRSALLSALKAVGETPWDAFAFVLASELLLEVNRAGEAASMARRALVLAPTMASAHRALGLALLSGGHSTVSRLREAVLELRAALRCEPWDPVAAKMLAEGMARLHNALALLPSKQALLRGASDRRAMASAVLGDAVQPLMVAAGVAAQVATAPATARVARMARAAVATAVSMAQLMHADPVQAVLDMGAALGPMSGLMPRYVQALVSNLLKHDQHLADVHGPEASDRPGTPGAAGVNLRSVKAAPNALRVAIAQLVRLYGGRMGSGLVNPQSPGLQVLLQWLSMTAASARASELPPMAFLAGTTQCATALRAQPAGKRPVSRAASAASYGAEADPNTGSILMAKGPWAPEHRLHAPLAYPQLALSKPEHTQAWCTAVLDDACNQLIDFVAVLAGPTLEAAAADTPLLPKRSMRDAACAPDFAEAMRQVEFPQTVHAAAPTAPREALYGAVAARPIVRSGVPTPAPPAAQGPSRLSSAGAVVGPRAATAKDSNSVHSAVTRAASQPEQHERAATPQLKPSSRPQSVSAVSTGPAEARVGSQASAASDGSESVQQQRAAAAVAAPATAAPMSRDAALALPSAWADLQHRTEQADTVPSTMVAALRFADMVKNRAPICNPAITHGQHKAHGPAAVAQSISRHVPPRYASLFAEAAQVDIVQPPTPQELRAFRAAHPELFTAFPIPSEPPARPGAVLTAIFGEELTHWSVPRRKHGGKGAKHARRKSDEPVPEALVDELENEGANGEGSPSGSPAQRADIEQTPRSMPRAGSGDDDDSDAAADDEDDDVDMGADDADDNESLVDAVPLRPKRKLKSKARPPRGAAANRGARGKRNPRAGRQARGIAQRKSQAANHRALKRPAGTPVAAPAQQQSADSLGLDLDTSLQDAEGRDSDGSECQLDALPTRAGGSAAAKKLRAAMHSMSTLALKQSSAASMPDLGTPALHSSQEQHATSPLKPVPPSASGSRMTSGSNGDGGLSNAASRADARKAAIVAQAAAAEVLATAASAEVRLTDAISGSLEGTAVARRAATSMPKVINLTTQGAPMRASMLAAMSAGMLPREQGLVLAVARRHLRTCRARPRDLVVLDVDDTALSTVQHCAATSGFARCPPAIPEFTYSHVAPACMPVLKFYQWLLCHGWRVAFICERPTTAHAATAAALQAAGFTQYEELVCRPRGAQGDNTVALWKAGVRVRLAEAGWNIVASVGDQEADLEGEHVGLRVKLPNYHYLIS